MCTIEKRRTTTEPYRIINLVLQLFYLLAHLLFTLKLLRVRQSTPVWSWFFLVSVSIWLWVSGRFAESIVYIFLPANNAAYIFAANYQFIGITAAASTYFIWSLYLAGHDHAADNKAIQALLILYPLAVCTVVFTNDCHHLFYTKLIMGQRVGHGPLFLPAMLSGYLLMFAGYLISAADIIRKGEQAARKLLLFSTFPFLPAIAIAGRSISGVDRLDFTPIVMGISYLCLYLVVFKYNDVNIIPASMEAVVEQTAHPIGIFNWDTKSFTYLNTIARQQYTAALQAVAAVLPIQEGEMEGVFAGMPLKAYVTPMPASGEFLLTAIDLTELSQQLAALKKKIAELEQLSLELEEENRNIDAYLDTHCRTAGLQDKKDLIDEIYRHISDAFAKLEANLKAADERPEACELPLRENLRVAEVCIKEIRAAVARLSEG